MEIEIRKLDADPIKDRSILLHTSLLLRVTQLVKCACERIMASFLDFYRL